MSKNKQDIYGFPSRGEENNGDSGGRTPPGNNARDEQFRQSKRSATIFLLILLAFMVFLSLFAIKQMQSKKQDSTDVEPVANDESVIVLRTDSVLDFNGDIQGQLIMDELKDAEPVPIPENEDIPLNTHWLKQAAIHLVKAEKAYDLQQWKEAISHYKKVSAINPDIAGVDAKLGLCYMRLNDFAASADAFEGASSEDTNSFRAINNLGVAYLADKQFSKAEQNFSRVLEMRPDYAPARYNMAMLYYRTEMYAKSASHFEQYFTLAPYDIDALQVYTKVLITLERWQDAARTLKKSAQELPEATPVYMALAHVLSNTGDAEAAMKNLEHGVSLLDKPKALAMIASPEYDKLRSRQDFKKLVDKLSSETESKF